MEEIRILPSILILKKTPAEKMLLAYICQRAALADGICTDSNKDLAQATGLHLRTIPDLVKRLSQAQCLQASVDQSQANKRTMHPVEEFLEGYTRLYSSIANAVQDYTRFSSSQNEDYTHMDSRAEKDHTLPLSQSLTPYPPVTDSRLWASGKAVPSGRRFCPVTGIDIGRQRNDVHYVTSETLKYLAKKQPFLFMAIANCFFPDETPDLDYPGELSSRMARAVQQVVISGKPIVPLVLPDRICPVTGLNLNHQGIAYTHATASTLLNLFKQNRALFDEVAAQFLTSDEMSESMSSQVMMLGNRVEKKANELGPLSQLLERPMPVLSRATLKPAPMPTLTELAAKERKPVRYCSVTGIDITRQRLDCRFATQATLERLYKEDKVWLSKLFSEFLTPEQASEESISMRRYYLAEAIRKVGKDSIRQLADQQASQSSEELLIVELLHLTGH